jgi:hypothetical protein
MAMTELPWPSAPAEAWSGWRSSASNASRVNCGNRSSERRGCYEMHGCCAIRDHLGAQSDYRLGVLTKEM